MLASEPRGLFQKACLSRLFCLLLSPFTGVEAAGGPRFVSVRSLLRVQLLTAGAGRAEPLVFLPGLSPL